MNILLKIIMLCYSVIMFPIVNYRAEIANATPECCGQPCEFSGSHQSLVEETFFFQCTTCGRIQVVPNQHKGLRLRNMFKMGSEYWKQISESNPVKEGKL